jgi:hypothetical protein
VPCGACREAVRRSGLAGRARHGCCASRSRCRYATKICGQQEPPLADYGGGHMAACHHPLNLGFPVAAAGSEAGTEAAESLPAVAGGEVPAEERQ